MIDNIISIACWNNLSKSINMAATIPKFVFADAATKEYFQAIITQIQRNPKTIEALQVVSPPIIRDSLISKYRSSLQTNPDATWSAIVQEISLTIILNAIQFVPAINNVHTITIPSIVSAYSILYTQPQEIIQSTSVPYNDKQCYPEAPKTRVAGRQLKYATAPSVSGPLPRTFLISGQCGFDHGPLREMFASLGFQEETFESVVARNNHVGTLFLEQSYYYNPKDQLRYDPRTSELTCAVKSILPDDKRCIANKEYLYYNMLEASPTLAPRYLAESRKLSTVNEVRPGEILILKPVGSSAGCGVGIHVVTSTPELQKAKSEILSAYPSGIASEYIQHPLLFNGKKFHFRMYFLARGPITCPRCFKTGGACSLCGGRRYQEPYFEIFSRGKILTAKDNYQLSDFSNPAIHDSHSESTAQNYFFPEDFIYCHTLSGKQYDNQQVAIQDILSQMQQVSEILGYVMKAKMRKWTYPESNFAYEIFGCDFLVEAKDTPTGIQNRVILLEVNDRIGNSPSFGGNPPPNWPPEEKPGLFRWDLSPYINNPFYQNLQEYIKFSALWWQWVLQTGIIPFYQFFEVRAERPAVPLTYIISGANGINHEPLRAILNSVGFSEVAVTAKPQTVGFICQEQMIISGRIQYDKRIYRFISFLKSLLDNRRYIVTDKSSLYFQLNQIAPELVKRYMATTQLVSQIQTVDKVLIVKPVSQPGQNIGGGQDITIVTSFPELKQVEEKLMDKYKVEPIASEYIMDPWLINGRKCHFRMFLLVRTAGVSISGRSVPFLCQLWDRGTLMTALLPYKFSDFGDSRIHDSHIRSTDRDLFFNLDNPDPTDTGLTIEQRQFVFRQMQEMMEPVGQIMQNNTFPYSDSTYAYEVFGVDFMLRKDTLTVVLLEINDHIGMKSVDSSKLIGYTPETGPWTPAYTEFSTAYWNWVFQSAIAPFFS
jgi:hypothetical protein